MPKSTLFKGGVLGRFFALLRMTETNRQGAREKISHVDAEPKHRMAVKIEKFTCLNEKSNSERLVNYELTNQLDSFATAQNDRGRHSELDSESINVGYNNLGNNITDKIFSRFTFHFSLKCAVNNQNSKVAFTLAEVLITLGIIGVIAALTLPTLIANKKAKELEVALKKNASILQQAVMMINLEDGEDLAHTVNGGRTLKGKLKPHLNVLKDCGYGTEISSCVVNTGFEANKDAKNVYKTYNKTTEATNYLFDDGQLLLADGSLILIEESGGSFNMFISVDVNGYQKGPNLWGHDLFTFEITRDGKFLPMGAVGTSATANIYCSKTSTNNMNGMACTYKALTDPNYFKQLP